MNAAIICLTRGYTELERYDTLIKRNEKIHEFFGNKYPLVIFHEGNITPEAQQYIIKNQNYDENSPPFEIVFINISEIWQGGYESMCQFYAYYVWNYCNKLGLDYILRIDEDCHITKMEQDPFEQINGFDYLRSMYFAESHSETNASLPQMIEKLTGIKREVFYNDKFVYTNVSLSSVKFWLEPDLNRILKEIALSPEQRKNRFGDLPILGSLLNIYGKVGVMKGLEYFHESHNMKVICE